MIHVSFKGSEEVGQLARRAQNELGQKKLLTGIGLRVLKWVNDNFRAGGLDERWKPLSPNTLASRTGGIGQPLRKTGRLAQSFDYSISGSSVIVDTNSKIAPFHQEGTSPYFIRPKSPGGSLRFMTAGGPVFAKVVRHPGLAKREMIPRQARGEQLAVSVINASLEKLNG